VGAQKTHKMELKIVKFWKPLVSVLLPLALSPIPIFIEGLESRAAWVVLVMGAFWGLELQPLAVTSLLPVIFYPLFSIMSTDAVCREYLKATTWLFLGSLIVAIAVEQSNLHRRIASQLLNLFGLSPRLLMLGFMIPTALLSMWISNTATTAMMMPILQSVLVEIEAEKNIRNMMFLAVAYAANIGGTGTLIGTGPNVVFYDAIYQNCPDSPISFLSWIYFAFPLAIVNLIICWIWLQVMYIGLPGRKNNIMSKEKEKRVSDLLKKRQKELGRMSLNEWLVGGLFFTLVMLWFFRDPDFMTGWESQIVSSSDIKIADATPAILIAVLIMGIPLSSGEPFLTWQVVEEKMNWGVILLIGGGFGLAAGMERSGLNAWVGEQLKVLESWDSVAVLFVVLIIISVITQVASNTATASMMLIVLLQLSKTLKMNPLFLMISATLTCSCAFMLPVSTAPNAIVFEASGMRTLEMMKAGLGMNVLTMFTIAGYMYSVGTLIFDLNSYPDWANNCTESNTGFALQNF